MSRVTLQAIGRVVLLRWKDILNGDAPLPDEVMRFAQSRKARFLVLDTTAAPFADSDGLRWLFKMRELSIPFRIAARPGGMIWRALKMFGLDQELYGSVRGACRAPWGTPHAHTPGRSRRLAVA